MRLLAVAFVTGLAFAAGVLGVGLHGIAGSGAPLQSGLVETGPQPQRSLPQEQQLATPAAHSNANTEGRPVYLNGRVIQGRPTILCTTNRRVLPILRQAIAAWNDALSRSLPFASDGGPFTIHDATGGVHTSCDDNRPTLDVDVVVVFEHASGSSLYDSEKSDPEEPPRKEFKTDDETSYVNSDHATLILRNENNVVQLSTLIHELGHVLGLSDYKTCDGLRVPGEGPAAADPDFHDQLYAVMYNAADRQCRPLDHETITDRDLPDLYEAYHVGAGGQGIGRRMSSQQGHELPLISPDSYARRLAMSVKLRPTSHELRVEPAVQTG